LGKKEASVSQGRWLFFSVSLLFALGEKTKGYKQIMEAINR